MSTLLRFAPVTLGTLVLLAIAVSGEIVQAQSTPVTASSQWGRGYGAAQAADGVAGINGNYWQTVQGKDKGAWWQQDLGKAFAVRGVKVSWARLENRVHCPPASMVIQVSLTGAEGSWKDVRRIGAQEIPRAGQTYPTECEWCYALPDKTEARFVRLFFPEGAQPGAKHPGYLCLGEVEVRSPGLPSRIVTIEGQFGKAEADVCAPSLVRLYLRGPNGLSEQSLLARSGPKPWAHGGYTYVVGEDDRRYESRLERPAKVELRGEGLRTVLQITGVKLAAMVNEEPVATEDWTLSTPGDGAQLLWKITRRWTIPATLTDLTVAADLHGGQVTATVELSRDGFTTIASSMLVRVHDGVNVYSLESLTGTARSVRVRFDLRRGPSVATTPVVDGFQVRGKPSAEN